MARQQGVKRPTKVGAGQASPVARRGAPESQRQAATLPAAGTLAVARLADLNEERRTVVLLGGDRPREAVIDASVDLVVVRGAIDHGEHAIVQHDGQTWQVLGALRTRATPGLEVGDDYVIEAKRIELRGEHELRITSGAVRFAIHAYGHVETVADTITTHARGVQKIVGRLLRLN